MNRSRLILIGSIALAGIALAVGYFLFVPPKAAPGETSGVRDFFSAFFPFGQALPPGNKPDEEPGGQSGQKVTTRLRQVSDRPVAGAWFTEGTSTTPQSIRFMERATGHIFETPVDSYAEVRLSNTTIPLTQELIPVSDTTFILRTIPDTEIVLSSFGVLNATTSQQSVHTSPLKRFERVAVAGDGLSLLTVTETASGSQIELMEPNGEKSRTILLSPIRSWVPLAGGKRFFLESAASSGIPGFLYEIKTDGGLRTVIGEIPGLLSLPSPSGRYVLYSGSEGTRTSLEMLDTESGERYLAPLRTLAAKCAWVSETPPLVFCGISDPLAPNSSNLPDDWFLGKVAFSDSAWLIRPVESSAESLGYLQEIAGVPFDITDVAISPDQKYAIFKNKNDLTLWALDLTRSE